MKYIEIDYLDSILMNALEELINKCDGYEPYYCDSHNDSFIQCALVDEDADSPVMYGFIGLLINDECGYVEVSALVAPDFRHRGHFRNMLSICCRKLKSSSAGNLELIAPISGELLNCSLCGDVCFYEYLYQLDKAHFNLNQYRLQSLTMPNTILRVMIILCICRNIKNLWLFFILIHRTHLSMYTAYSLMRSFVGKALVHAL